MSLLTPSEVDLIMTSTLSGDTSVLGSDAEFGWWHPRVPKMLKKVEHGLAKAATSSAHVAVVAAKKTGKVSMMPVNLSIAAAKWPAKKMMELSKLVASKAATPIKMAAKPTIMNTAHALAGPGVPPTKAHKKAASKMVITHMKNRANPLVKFGGYVLNWVGSGVSGSDVGVFAADDIAEIYALAAASAAAIAKDMAAGAGKDLIKAGMKKSGLPDHVPTEQEIANAGKNKLEAAAQARLAAAQQQHIDDTEAALTPEEDAPEEEAADETDDDTQTPDSDEEISGNVLAGLPQGFSIYDTMTPPRML